MFKAMRILALGMLACLCIAGCGDNAPAAKTATTTPKAAPTPPPTDPTKVEIKDTLVGKGRAAAKGDTLFMAYTGKLLDGTVFDATSKHDDTPFTFVLGAGKVIPGWDQGLVGMKEGGSRTLVIPASLAYGASPPPKSSIPVNANLVFDVTLYKVIKPDDLGQILVTPVKEGTGPKAGDGDTVQVKYKGTFVNGKVFDPGDQPLTVTIGAHGVVPGFEAAITGMQKGGERIATIPPEYGYGDQANGSIPPGSWLVFDITVLSITHGTTKK